MHVFSKLPRDLNFIDHTSNITWKACVPCSITLDCKGLTHVFSMHLIVVTEMSS
jgi:hypothetical protein